MKKLTYISGGIGGAKLAKGFYDQKNIELSIIVNTGDDEIIHGVKLSPDVDSVMYALANMEGEFGWGQKDDTFNVSDYFKNYKSQQLSIGDKDLALKLFRNQMLHDGHNLTEITKLLTEFYNLNCAILPMTNDHVKTTLTTTDDEILSFQEYFVERKAEPELKEVVYKGAEKASITDEVTEALMEADQIVIGPSNPILSIGPILGISIIKELISCNKNVTVVSPFIDNRALKGPSDKNFKAFGFEPNIEGLKVFYEDIANKFIVHENEKSEKNIKTKNILFSDEKIAVNLAKEIISDE
jgi:LPPG:FO 2-phospho-L-lactate transferase